MEAFRIKIKNIKVICGLLCTLSLMLIFIQNINIKELYVMLSHTNIKVLGIAVVFFLSASHAGLSAGESACFMPIRICTGVPAPGR